jgi:hypothetical protein
MDRGDFDDFSRSVGRSVDTRRVVFRLLAGGALVGVAARLGLAEGTEAKKKRKRRTPQADQRTHDALQTEGNRNHKAKHHKKAREQTPAPPPDPPCPEGLGQCPDKTCVPFNQCCSDQDRCGDRTCVSKDDCCPGEKKCPPDSESGSASRICVGKTDCCPDEKKCGVNCIARQACCDEDSYPLCGP